MNNNTDHNQGDSGFNGIKPAEILLTNSGRNEAGVNRPIAASANRGWLWPALVALIVIAAAVIFVLPQYVQAPLIPANAGSESAAIPTTNVAPPAPVEAAPWQTAQLARQRGKSQELLSQMLELQEQLEQKNVEAWAGAEYDRILQLAIDGDAAYRQQDFDGSATLYSKALEGMSGLLNNTETLFEQAVSQGNVELDQGNAVKAEQAFTQALLMKPDAETAATGLQRARTLDQVLQLITQGNDLQQNGKLEQAKQVYEQALALDSLAGQAQQQLAEVNARIRDNEFNRAMSAGYTHLQNGDPARAKTSFQQANRIKPGTSEASSALTQIQTQLTNDQITTILQSANTMEGQEKWQEAVAEYDKALALDANLAVAQEGKQYANSRAVLDGRLEQLITQPGRLSDKAVHEDARLLYQQATAISPPEPRLATQLATLDKLLTRATVPVAVALRSDNQTEVTLLRVGPLGRFVEKNMTLFPGNYTAVGTRQGYRDVRIEFSVSADNPTQAVEVTAAEKIAAR